MVGFWPRKVRREGRTLRVLYRKGWGVTNKTAFWQHEYVAKVRLKRKGIAFDKAVL